MHGSVVVPPKEAITRDANVSVMARYKDVPQASSCVLEVEELSVFYGSVEAVRDVSLRIEERRIMALIGPSGCGKTERAAMSQPHE